MEKKNDFLIGLVLSVTNLLIAALLLFSIEYVGPLTSLITALLVLAGICISIEIIFVWLINSALCSFINWKFDSQLANIVRDAFRHEALEKRTAFNLTMGHFIDILFIISIIGLAPLKKSPGKNR
jgi:hypothetical protein